MMARLRACLTWWWWLLLALLSLVYPPRVLLFANAFCGVSSSLASFATTASQQQQQQRSLVLHAAAASNNNNNNNSDDDDLEDDEDEDAPALGDWRKFRATLIAQEKPSTASAAAVAPQNQALLQQQNQALAAEYQAQVWAHTIGQPEVGGLLCRLPLEAELYHGGTATSSSSTSFWKDKLSVMVQLEKKGDKTDDDNNNNNNNDISDATRAQKDDEAETLATVEQ